MFVGSSYEFIGLLDDNMVCNIGLYVKINEEI